MMAEVVASWANAARFLVRLVVSIPAVVDTWGNQKPCPLNPRGHWIAKHCGRELFSLDEMFSSIERANNHFWRIFSQLANMVRPLGGVVASDVANILEGVGMYGESTQNPAVFAKTLKSFDLPVADIGLGMMQVAGASPVSVAMSLSVNPLRMARWSYRLVTGWITDLIPLLIRIQKDSKDQAAIRDVVHMMSNHVLDSKREFVGEVLLGMKQGCGGVAMMMGYTNPWAMVLRTQCESIPVAIEGLFNLFTSVTLGIPFSACVCVDANKGGVDFATYVENNCYYFAPTGLKSLMLDLLVQYRVTRDVDAACVAIVDLAKREMTDSMRPWFRKQYDSARYMGASVEHVVSALSSGSVNAESGCAATASDPFVALIMPEPSQFFAGCAGTTECATKCFYEMQAFQAARDAYGDSVLQPTKSRVQVSESPLFVSYDEDSVLPFAVLAMVELSRCVDICGGGAVVMATEFTQDEPDGESRYTCMAMTGILDGQLHIRKYCMPKRHSEGVRASSSGDWVVQLGAGVLESVRNVHFGDTQEGDTVVLFRDNTGRGDVADSGPQRQFVTVHSRELAALDPDTYDSFYGSEELQTKHLLLATLEDLSASASLSISSVLVIPTDEVRTVTWLLLRVVVRTDDFTTSGYQTYCMSFMGPNLIAAKGRPDNLRPQACAVEEIFLRSVGDRRVMVTMASDPQHPATIEVLMLPTVAREDAIVRMRLGTNYGGLVVGDPVVIRTDKQFVRNTGMVAPSQLATSVFSTASPDASLRGVKQGSIVQEFTPTTAQNSVSTDPTSFNVYVTKDPTVSVAWLTQHRIAVVGEVGSLATASSQKTSVVINMQLACDRYSCLGCVASVQALCYNAQQCTVERCIGVPINVRKPLCNVGATLQMTVEGET
jgi:hypothetical protein